MLKQRRTGGSGSGCCCHWGCMLLLLLLMLLLDTHLLLITRLGSRWAVQSTRWIRWSGNAASCTWDYSIFSIHNRFAFVLHGCRLYVWNVEVISPEKIDRARERERKQLANIEINSGICCSMCVSACKRVWTSNRVMTLLNVTQITLFTLNTFSNLVTIQLNCYRLHLRKIPEWQH